MNNFNEVDKYYILNLFKNKNLINDQLINPNIINTDPIFNYNINFTDNTNQILSSNNEYNIKLNDDLKITNPEINSDSINFFSDKLIKNNDIIVSVSEKYKINSFDKYGSLYILSISNINKITKDSDIYFNDYKKAKLLEINSSDIKIISSNLIDKLYNLRIIDLIKVISTTTSTQKTIIKLSNNISSIFLKDNTYIEIDDVLYMLYYDTNYYIDGNINIKKNRLYKITRNIDITKNEVRSFYISDITLDRNMEDYFYFNQTDNNLDEVNFFNSNMEIKDVDIVSKNKIRVYHNVDNIITNDIILHNYKIRQSIYYNIDSIVNMNKYLYNLDIDFSNKKKENIIITIGTNSTEIVDNKKNNLEFYLTSFIDPVSLNDMTLVSKYIYNLSNVTLIDNTIICDIPDDFILNSTNKYYFNGISESKILVTSDKLNITVSGDIVINTNNTLEEIGTFTDGKFNISKPEFNNLCQINLTNDFNSKNKTNVFNPYISVFDKNISGNMFSFLYYYKFVITSSNVIFTDFIYVIYNNKTYKVKIIMIQQNENNYNVRIGSDILFELDNQIKIYTEDYKFNFTVTFSISNTNLIKTKYNQNINDKNIEVFVNNNLDEYDINKNITLNDYIFYTKYSDINLLNKSYKNVGFNKFIQNNSQITTNTIEYKDVKFVDELSFKFFKTIEFIIDNKVIERLDYDSLKILFSYYNESPDYLTKITKVNREGDFYVFDLILPFFYTKRPSDYLPLFSLKDKNIKIRFTSEKINNLIDKTQLSEYSISKNIEPIIEFYYAYNNMNPNKLLPSKKKLIDTMNSYQTIIIKNQIEHNVIKLPGRIKEIFMVIKNKKYNISYEYDSWYSLYLTNYEKYKNQTNNNTSIYEIEDYYII